MVINTCTRDQLARAFWPYQLAPLALQACQRVHPPSDTLQALLDDAGFDHVDRVVPVDAVLQGEAYFNPQGPLQDAWRHGDSFWELVSAEELEAAAAQLRALDCADGVQDFLREHDQDRALIGQITFYVAERG